MLTMSASEDLLNSLTHAITNPLAEDLNILSLLGVESLYREFLDVKRWNRDGPGVKNMITVFISEGLLAKVLEKTLLYNQTEGPQINTSTAHLLLTLSLKAYTTDTRVRAEMSRAIHILSEGWAEQIHDPLTGWLQEALFRFPWIWPTARRARVIPLFMARVESTCHRLQNTSSNLIHGLMAIEILGHLYQDHIANNARLMQIVRPESENHIRRLSQDIQFSAIESPKTLCLRRVSIQKPASRISQLSRRQNGSIFQNTNL